MAFDYKADVDSQSHAVQYALVAPALLSGILLALIGPRFRFRSKLRQIVSLSIMLTIVGSIVPYIIQGNEADKYLRAVFPSLLFAIGYAAGCHPWSEKRARAFEKWLFYSMALSSIGSFISGLATGGPIDDVRYHIVSPTLLGFQGYLLYMIVVLRHRTPLILAFFALTLGIELFSVTRSLLIGTILLFFLAAWISASDAARFVSSTIRTSAVAIASAVLIGGVSASLFPSVLDHWSQRIFYAQTAGNGKDPTTLSRLAELQNQYDQVTSDVPSLLFGKGYGHKFHYAEKYIQQLLAFAPRDALESQEGWSAGHNFWVYQFFAGGIFFGIALPASLLYALYRCATMYRRAKLDEKQSPHFRDIGKYLMITAGMAATTIGGNPLGPRYSGLIYGVALGILIAAYSRFGSLRRLNNVQRSASNRLVEVGALSQLPR
ncbi:hypothetical protein [Burkholderia sp. Ac-20353]|uniref:hypothetical protein n=1 Tax=Burkholderia sp. Ac-20353 TaxID=2703894 RepID=UPI00197C0A6E|nr:hypothetical protein [Burkholderia sp. Ac-20353]MBN3788769.1 hypothetical protein [Burkholderia sp. Ac-20353]